ncbi:MAG: cation:proton antiporter [Nanoarchaeota archaeon]|nr:cation:proton antiporter [Nanoarchaeota archaeon]
MVEAFVQISVVIAIVFAVSVIMKFLRQPLIIGYILSGIIVGPFVLNAFTHGETLKIFSEFGIAFLLFIVGLHLSPRVVKDVGKISIITGVGQIVFTVIFGFLISWAFGFSIITSLYIAIALTFSSTIIITKLLSDRGDLGSLYGKISIGFLLVQDLVAMVILIAISSLSSGESFISSVGTTLIKGTILTALIVVISVFVLPVFQKTFAKSQELLFVFSLAWGLGIASLFHYAGLSLEVGALIAGVVLAVSPYSFEISVRMKPLRDFFIIYFFIFLGSQMILSGFGENLVPAIIFSLFILIGNPLIVMSLMGLFGYTKRIGFMAGLTVAQISEFSLILIALGVKVGHISQEILSLVTFVGIITIAGSAYMIIYADKIYPKISKYLRFFEKGNVKKEKILKKDYDAILLGYNRIGFSILKSFKHIKKKYLVVDFNPDVVADLKKLRIPILYGDAYDSDLLSELPLKKAQLIVSTIPDLETNVILIETVRITNPKAIIIVRAHSIEDAMIFYKKGATYVLTPHFLGGEYVAKMIRTSGVEASDYEEERSKHIKMLEERKKQGHDHPAVEKN